MRHPTFAVAFLIASVLASTVAAQTPATKIAPSRGWLNNLETGKALAAKTGRPLMLVFRCDP